MQAQITREAAAARTLRDPRWSAVVGRDRTQDGKFFYCVKTTGVYCRPSCGSRLANPRNVNFYATAAEAEAAGFRPCKRCRPNRQSLAAEHAAKVARACRSIERVEEPPTLTMLSREAGMSPYHFHRLFKATTGLTPKEYANAHRAGRVRGSLTKDTTVTEAIFNAGFNSNSRFYEQADAMLGMKPSRFRERGVNEEIRFAVGQSSLGAILVAASSKGVCAITLGEDPNALVRELQDRFSNAKLVGADEKFESLVAQVVGMIEAPGLGTHLPLDVRGTAFQRRVWKALSKIPPGATASYGKVARQIGAPKAVRAVAQACAANPLAIAIPCHRVVRNDGGLSGYRWGVERKRALLTREGVIPQ
jgi:AraC family transcriptional regulator of adaptative response/methylated-DNA-[protein]-cysteine methyltransferase